MYIFFLLYQCPSSDDGSTQRHIRYSIKKRIIITYFHSQTDPAVNDYSQLVGEKVMWECLFGVIIGGGRGG